MCDFFFFYFSFYVCWFQIVRRRRAASVFVNMRVIGSVRCCPSIQYVSHGCSVFVRCVCAGGTVDACKSLCMCVCL